jgi:DNA-binding CsgD family transcriptional regulator
MTRVERRRLAFDSVDDAGAPELLAWLSLFICVPRSLVVEVWPGADSALRELERSGRVRRTDPDAAVQSVAIIDSARQAQQSAAIELWGADAVRAAHRAALDFWLSSEEPAQAVFHYEQLGENASARRLLKEKWSSAAFSVGADEFRQTVRRLHKNPRGNDFLELLAIERLISTLPLPPVDDSRVDVRLTNVDQLALEALEPRSRIAVASAVVLALTSSGRLKQAIAFGEEFLATEPVSAFESAEVWNELPTLWEALAEAYVTAGWSRRATFWAAKAENATASHASTLPHFRALSLQSVACALNGDYSRALELSARARTISAERQWAISAADYPLILSDLFVASARLDHESLSAAAHVLDETFPSNRLWTTTAMVSSAMAELCLNNVEKGITLIRRVLNGTDRWGLLDIVRGFAVGIHADLLLAAGSPGETVTLLRDVPSSLGHALCFDMQRSTARLMLGQPGEVLRSTDACIAMGEEHCLRTLPPVLFRRAIAYEELGLPDAADRSFHEGFLLLRETKSLTPLLSLSPATIGHLAKRLRTSHPEYANALEDLFERSKRLPQRSAPVDESASPRFTQRELQLATALRSGASTPQIAETLFLSRNTIKVHLRHLYSKLGAHSRSEALARIEALGIHNIESTPG